jgi:hypothetical protein
LYYQIKQSNNAEILKHNISNIIKTKVMKKQTPNQFSPITKEQTEKLTAVVKETLALGQAKTFSSADLWNIQRRGRTMMSRRNYFA